MTSNQVMAVTRTAVAAITLAAVAACSGAPGPGGLAAEEDRIAIYAAVIHHMTAEEGQESGFSVIYVLDRVVANADDPDDPGAGTSFPDEDRAALRRALTDLASVEFVSSREEVTGPQSEGNRVQSNGIFLTLGPIHGEEDRVLVPASSYLANLAGTWQTWVVERQDGGWKVTGTEGPVAIS
jgi:hypothetical protein